MYTLGGSRQPAFQLPATDIPSSSTLPLFQFQAQPGAFDTGAEDQLGWDEIRYDDILATMEGAPQQANELATSQFTQPPPVLTHRHSWWPTERPRVAERHRRAVERHRPAERHQMMQTRRRQPWRHRLPTS
jgi:hypothetical protein